MQENEEIKLLNNLNGPAFFVEDQIVTQVNPAAEQRQILPGVNIMTLITTGSQEYHAFRSGKLYLQLHVSGLRYNACVTFHKKAHLFCILSDYASKELQVLSLTSTNLRAPLQCALDGIDELSRRLCDSTDPAVRKSFGQVNHGLHQLLRSVRNMSDAALYSQLRLDQFKYIDVNATLAEIAEKIQTTVPTEVCTVNYSGLSKQIFTMADPQALERAIYNLVSNAAKFSSPNSVVTLKASEKANRLYITLENNYNADINPAAQLFDNYLRTPAIEESRLGIGLGLAVVRNIISAHYGTLLVSQNQKNTISFTLAIPVREESSHILRSPFSIKVDYSGGYNLALVELSDILPDEMYETF